MKKCLASSSTPTSRWQNLECPILPTTKRFVFGLKDAPLLSYTAENFAIARGRADMKYRFMATASNHSLDFGSEGVASTIAALTEEGIAFHGTNAQEADAFQATIIRKKEFTIGLVAYTFGLNGHQPPAERPHIVNRLRLNDGVAANDFSQFEKQLQHCRQEGADFVIAHLHW